MAAGGQDGVLKIWCANSLKLVAELENPRRWIDQLAWHPSCNQVAFSLGKKIQIWDAESRSAGGQGGEVLIWKRDEIESSAS